MKMKTARIMPAGILGVVMAIGISAVSGADDFGTKILRIVGTREAASALDVVAKKFKDINPESAVVVSGGETAKGIESFLNGNAEVVMSSRKLTGSELKLASDKGMKLVEKEIGHEDLIIMVHPTNPVNELTVEQLVKIFKGEITDWSQVGGKPEAVIPHVPNKSESGTFIWWMEEFMAGAPLAQNVSRHGNYLTVVNDVATGNGGIGGIGFCSSWHMAALEKKGAGQSVKVLAIKKDSNTQAVKPILGTHEERDYPIERPLHIYYDSNKGKLTQAFVEFCVKTIKFANVNSSRS